MAKEDIKKIINRQIYIEIIHFHIYLVTVVVQIFNIQIFNIQNFRPHETSTNSEYILLMKFIAVNIYDLNEFRVYIINCIQ